MKRLSFVIILVATLVSAAYADNYSEGMRIFNHAYPYRGLSWTVNEFKTAYELLAKAGKEGYADADYYAGIIRLYGLDDVTPDIDKAFAHFSTAVENESQRGRTELGDIYLTSSFRHHDEAKAFDYWNQAYDFNEPDSRSRVFAAYWFGIGTEPDKSLAAGMAKGHYEEISNSHYIISLVALARLLENPALRSNINGEYEDPITEAAYMYYLTGVPRYMIEGARLLVDNKIDSFSSRIHYDGYSVTTTGMLDKIIRAKENTSDEIKAEACLLFAKFADAMAEGNRKGYDNHLTFLYGYNSGEALLMAASLGNPEAIEMAALWYRLGMGLPKNLVKAREYEALLAEKFPERVKAPAEVNYVVGEGEIVENPAVKAQFPGPPGTWQNWVANNLNDPGDKEGNVTVSFIVEQDGSLSDIKVTGGNATPDMRREAMRLTRVMPKMIPAKDDNGNPVRSRLEYTYRFIIMQG